jgi:uncharacterized protein
MSLEPITIKPKMTLDDFRSAQGAAKDTGVALLRQMYDAFQNAAARTGFGTSNLLEGTSYPFNRITLNYVLLTSLYRGNWIIRKIVDAMADDMLKNGFRINSELPPEKLARFDKEGLDETGTMAQLGIGMKWGRLYGGAGGVIALKGRDDFEKPIVPEEVELNSYRGLLIFDRWSGINPGITVSQDIDAPLNWGLPEFYQINTQQGKSFKVHHSRVLRFCGPALPNWEFQANMYWGASVIEAMFEELKKRDNTSWNIASLIFRANIMELNSPELSQMLSGIGANANAANRFYQSLTAQTQLMSNQGLMVTGKDQGLRSHQFSFGGLAEMYTQFMLDICGATEYAMSRLFGRSSSGLAGTNEGDEHSYYELVGQKQKSDLNPNMRKLLPVIAMSVWGKIPKDFSWTWNPVRALSNEDQAELGGKKTTAVIEAFNAGVIGRQTALMELHQSSEETGLFSNITEEDIESADSEPMMMGEMGLPGGGLPGNEGPSEDSDKPVTPPAGKPGKPGESKPKESKPEVKKVKDAFETKYTGTGKPQFKVTVTNEQGETTVSYTKTREKAERQVGSAKAHGWTAKMEAMDAEPELEAEGWNFSGLRVDVENLAGSVRHGRNHHTRMTAPYGYIRNTEGTDGDEVDCFVGSVLDAPYAYVIHTKNPATDEYDEDKVILGVESARRAQELFEENYDRPGFFESMERMTIPELKKKLKTLRGRKLEANA